ncbi:hypothetical protein H072_2277 [Dactylellina haptotyla CBS 200.50]|uniref:DUF833 domain-containing protein n=1 Tax=Dactylellina haptotyla (strain CBS 200.50) TaxID=1284197 RepID=S8ARU5_DACHA|nr:hypothetical protein H072_2277 [Dactylellina haptotyla CBS 200.50]
MAEWEFLHRPTQDAGPWTPEFQGVFGGRDLARIENGTWLGINRVGRFAGLTNIREETSVAAIGSVSRGAIVSSFLASRSTHSDIWANCSAEHGPEEFPDTDQVGGFSMLFGQLIRNSENKIRVGDLGVFSNRGKEEKLHIRNLDRLDPNNTDPHGLSNSTFTKPWRKVLDGEVSLNRLVNDIQLGNFQVQDIFTRAFDILSRDSLSNDPNWRADKRLDQLKQSIFIPMFETGKEAGIDHQQSKDMFSSQGQPNGPHLYSHYGTQKQTVIVVLDSGSVRYAERTLFDWLQGNGMAENHTVNISYDLAI